MISVNCKEADRHREEPHLILGRTDGGQRISVCSKHAFHELRTLCFQPFTRKAKSKPVIRPPWSWL